MLVFICQKLAYEGLDTNGQTPGKLYSVFASGW